MHNDCSLFYTNYLKTLQIRHILYYYCKIYNDFTIFNSERSNASKTYKNADVRSSAASGVKKKSPGKTGAVNSIKCNYARISETTPEPTVRPPSRIAKRRPSSIAIVVVSSTVIVTLSPGMHISTPSGSSITPVTSVVLK